MPLVRIGFFTGSTIYGIGHSHHVGAVAAVDGRAPFAFVVEPAAVADISKDIGRLTQLRELMRKSPQAVARLMDSGLHSFASRSADIAEPKFT